MRLWTIQDQPGYERLLERETLYGDWRRVDRDFKKPYQWLCWQMEEREISLKGRCPMWAWSHKPDMRLTAHSWRGAHGVVRLELEVPDELVLLSNFEAWHCVLNDHYLVTNDEELEKMFDYPRDEVVASWQKIFDLKHCSGVPGYCDWAQATFPTIELDYIISVRDYAPR